jgi:phosphoribosylglycinamide formyltransferase-1
MTPDESAPEAPEEFVSEPLRPEPGAFTSHTAGAGEPALPVRFTWRKTPYEVVEVLKVWKSYGDDRGSSSERYLRRHWYRIRTTDGTVMTIYFDRQPTSFRKRHQRWWIYTVARNNSDR